MQNLVQELVYATRQLSKKPAFAVTAILTLALGIGANTAIFTVVHSLLIAPLDYPDASRIMALDTVNERDGRLHPRVTGPDLADIRDQAKSVQAISYYQNGELGVQLRDHATFTGVAFVDSAFARVFDIAPLAGRWFGDSEWKHSAVVNAAFARNNFGSVEAALGETVKVEGEPLKIVGVLPASFEYPKQTQVWSASPTQPESTSRTAFNYQAVARLRRGVALAAAQAELVGIGKRLQASYPSDNREKTFRFVPLQEQLVGAVRPMLLLLLFSVALVLLIACVNVTHLYLARAVERQREMAVRTALGSSRLRLGRMVVIEALLLSLAGALLGIALAVPLLKLLVSIAPAGLPRANDIHLDLWIFAFTGGVALIATLAASFAPARQASRVDPMIALKQDSSRGMSSRHSFLMRNGLVVAEVAAAFVLAVGASLLARTMLTLQSVAPGYSKASLLIVDADAPAVDLKDSLAATRKFNAIFTELRSLPGVESVGGAMGLPTGKYGSNGYYSVNGAAMDVHRGPQAIFSLASPDYFQDPSDSAVARQGLCTAGRLRRPFRRHHQPVFGPAELPRSGSHRASDPMRPRCSRQVDDDRRRGGRCSPGFAGRLAGRGALYAAYAASVHGDADQHRPANQGCADIADRAGAAENPPGRPGHRDALHHHGRDGRRLGRDAALSRNPGGQLRGPGPAARRSRRLWHSCLFGRAADL